MDEASVSVVIVTPEAGELLDDCLASLARQSAKPREVVVVLNGCSGRDKLSKDWSDKLKIDIISSDRNVGFAKAHLLAMSHVSSKWIAPLNADAVAESDWLEEMLEVGESSPDIAGVASAVLQAGEPSRLESLGIEVGAGGAAYLRRWGERYREEGPQEVFGPAGAAAMYRRETIERVGFFDEGMFAYYEDVDLAWRFRWAGRRAMAAPRARVHHKGSAFENYSFKTYHLHRNRLAVIAMNWPVRIILRNFFEILLTDIPSILLSVVKERSMRSILARGSFIVSLPRLLSMRHKRLKGRVPGAERWIFDDRSRALERLGWKLS